MKYLLRTENIELTSLDRRALEQKLHRLQKYISIPYTIDIVFKHDAHHLKGNVVACRINVKQGKEVFHAERTGGTIADSLDEVTQALLKELQKHHEKVVQQKHEDMPPVA